MEMHSVELKSPIDSVIDEPIISFANSEMKPEIQTRNDSVKFGPIINCVAWVLVSVLAVSIVALVIWIAPP